MGNQKCCTALLNFYTEICQSVQAKLKHTKQLCSFNEDFLKF